MLATLLYTMTTISAIYQLLPVFITQSFKHTTTLILKKLISNLFSATIPNNLPRHLKQNWSRDLLT